MRIKDKNFRINETAATAILSRLTPRDVKHIVAKLFARSCRHAHIQSPACWELTLTPSFLRLNVGQVALLDVKNGELFLCAARPLARIARGIRAVRGSGPVYAAVPIDSTSLRVAVENVGLLDKAVLSAHRRYIEEAASRKRASPWRAAHSPAAVQVLAKWCGETIPQPSYFDSTDDPELQQEDIEAAVAEFASSREVERAAIRFARQRYQSQGWQVVSVEADHVGYDLRCTKGKRSRHIEVKGRAHSGKIVLLTANEWSRAVKDPEFVIAIVSNIGEGAPLMREWNGAEFQRSHEVKPIVFHASRRQD